MACRLEAVLVIAAQVHGAGFVPELREPVAQPSCSGAQIENAQMRTHGRQYPILETGEGSAPDPPLPRHRMILRAVRQVSIESRVRGSASFGEPDLGVVSEELFDERGAFWAQHAPDAAVSGKGVTAPAALGGIFRSCQRTAAQRTGQGDQTRSNSRR